MLFRSVAIQEFAPGKYLVHDKSKYFTAGYVGSELRRNFRSSQEKNFESMPDGIGEVMFLVECPVCLSWSRVMSVDSHIPLCECCGSNQAGSIINTTFIPRGFIGSIKRFIEFYNT